VFGLEVLKDVERQVQMIRENLKVAQSGRKSYTDKRRRDLSIEVGDFVYLKVSPMRGTQSGRKSYTDKRRRDLSIEVGDFVYLKVSPMRGTRSFKVKGKLAPRYVGPFQVMDCMGEVPYQLELLPQLSDVHDVFHVSQLKKCL
jgi:exosome complex RNA-binding protein Rrp4